MDPLWLRTTFNGAAQDYDAIRPKYPAQVFDDILALTGLSAGCQALEIGCGTGQASLPFAQRGCRLTCLDIGAELLAAAARNLAAYPQVRFEQAAFEDWPCDPAAFDLVYAATAFHWVPREVGCLKAARLLRPGGALAIFSNEHPGPYTGFFEEVQPLYRRYLPDLLRPPKWPSSAEGIRQQANFINASGLFASLEVRTYPWQVTYTAAGYLQLLGTYSDHLAADPARRRSLYQAIAELIDGRYAGQVERPYLTVLFLAKKAA